MRWLLAGLLLVLLVLQYRLWFAEGSLAERHRLEQQIEAQARVNRELRARNAALEREVLDLQSGNKGLEQRAREQLGLIRQGETFYQFVDRPAPAVAPAAGGTASGESDRAAQERAAQERAAQERAGTSAQSSSPTSPAPGPGLPR